MYWTQLIKLIVVRQTFVSLTGNLSFRVRLTCLSRLPDDILKGTKNSLQYDVSESPLIAFINARSGGRLGPELLDSLYRALGNPQVYDVLDDRPDRVLKTIWSNLEELEKKGDRRAKEIKKRFKIAACGGDGTVTWVMKVIKDLELDPPPAIAIVPLGTGQRYSLLLQTFLYV